MQRMRIEVIARNDFWRKAIAIEWEYQYPGRQLEIDADGYYLIEPEWLADFQAVAKQCLSKAVPAPADPGRRLWFRRLLLLPPKEK